MHPPSSAELSVVRIVGEAKPLSVTNRSLFWVWLSLLSRTRVTRGLRVVNRLKLGF